MKLLVCGGREYGAGTAEREYLFEFLDRVRAKLPVTEVVQGGARGADSCAKAWAQARSIPCTEVRADWDRHGKSAGYKRNQVMASMLTPGIDAVIAFPGGKGTQHMIDIARQAGLKVRVVLPLTTSAHEPEHR